MRSQLRADGPGWMANSGLRRTGMSPASSISSNRVTFAGLIPLPDSFRDLIGAEHLATPARASDPGDGPAQETHTKPSGDSVGSPLKRYATSGPPSPAL